MNVREIPDPTAFGFRAPKWQAAHEEHARLQRELSQAVAEQGALRTKVMHAKAADSLAYADAIRQGNGDPGTQQTDAIEREQQAVHRKAAALELAVEQAHGELVAAVEEEREDMLAEVENAVAERRATLAAAVDAWAESRIRHAEAVALGEFLSDFPEGRFKLGGGYLRNQPPRGDGAPPPPAAHVLAMLRADAAEKEARPQPANIRPLEPTMREVAVTPYANLEPTRDKPGARRAAEVRSVRE